MWLLNGDKQNIIMKTKFLILAFLSFITFSFAKVNSDLPKFPTYSQSMDLGIDCSADCFFSSCSGAGTCSCSCSWFDCSCAPSNPKDIKPIAKANQNVHVEDISMNKIQFERTKDFAMFVKSLKTESTDEVYTNLTEMVKALKEKDNNAFNKTRKSYLSSLNNLKQDNKEAINNYFVKVGASERI